MKHPRPTSGLASQPYRWVTAALGLLFVGLAGMIVCTAEGNRAGAYGATLVVGGLGIDALVSAAWNRRSLLSRLGPLP